MSAPTGSAPAPDTQQRLRESEARFRSLANLSSDWYWEQDEQLRFSWSSPGAEARGAPVRETLGMRRWEVPGLVPLSQTWEEHKAALYARQSFRDFEYLRIDPDGGRHYVSISGEPLYDEAGRFKGYRGTARDITERKLSELRMERLTAMYAALSAANEAILRAAAPEEIFRRACEIAVDAGRFVLGTVFTIDPASGLLVRAAASGPAARLPGNLPPTIDLAQGAGQGVIGLACSSGEPQIVNDYRNDTRVRFRPSRGYEIGAAAVFPLRVRGALVGVYGLQHADAGVFSDEMVALLQRLADNISFAIENFDREQRFQAVVDSANEGILVYDRDHRIVAANAAAERIIGAPAAEMIGKPGFTSMFRCINEDGSPLSSQDRPTRATVRSGEPLTGRILGIVRPDRSVTWISVNTALLQRSAQAEHSGVVSTINDITERKAAERRIALHARRQEGIARLGQFALDAPDLDGVFREAVGVLQAGGADAAAVYEIVAASGEYLVRAAEGSDAARASVGRSARPAADSAWRWREVRLGAITADRRYFRSRPPELPWSWIRTMGSGVEVPFLGDSGLFGILSLYALAENAVGPDEVRFVEAVANVLSGTVRHQQAATRLAHMAQFDALTGLANRRLLEDRLALTVARAGRQGQPGAVLFIDLDRFKLVNDTLGHQMGDALIAEVGRRLQGCVRGGDTVGRVSGDEFGVVLADLTHVDDAAVVAQKILDALAEPYRLGGNEAFVTASIGISTFPADGSEAETLLKQADMAMYRAKELRNAYGFFTAELNLRSVAKMQINTDLRHAVERGEFVLHYQPKVDLRDARIVGIEALLRWQHPQRGLVAPAEFIPALEDSGLILRVGHWVLEEAGLQLQRWRSQGLEAPPVAVNLSARQFRRREIDALLRRLPSAAGVASSPLELEITESCLSDDSEEAVRLLHALHEAGLKVSLDGFGSGFSSLSVLTRLPPGTLKIDGKFVRDAATRSAAATVVRSAIDMAHNLQFTALAEGVETSQQAAFLRGHGCHLAQGYLFGAPMPAPELAARLRPGA